MVTRYEWGVECNGWGRRHIEQHPTHASAVRRVQSGHGAPTLVCREVTEWVPAPLPAPDHRA